jgi:hypothetical protein
MPTGPRDEKRPADVIGCAVIVARLSVGDTDEKLIKPSRKVRSGRAGGKARAKSLRQDQRREIAMKAVVVRWGDG